MARRGISLVALVITIIVLIILTAGVIMLAGGENGIIGRAQRAVEANNLATATEKVLLEVSNIKMDAALTGQNVLQYLYDEINGATRREALEEKGIEVEQDDNGMVFTVNGEYAVITDSRGNIQNTEKSVPFTITDLSITTDGQTTPEDETVVIGTPLQINFTATVTGGTGITVTPTLPYTTNGTEKTITFTITGRYEGTEFTKTREISVESKYIGALIGFDNIEIGDYVNYDAGTWTQTEITALQTAGLYSNTTEELPSTPYTFGGFKVGDSRNNCIGGGTYPQGWVVIAKNVVNNTITIAHAGTPEYYFDSDSHKSEYILSSGTRKTEYADGLIARTWDMYENEYAVEGSAHLLYKEEVDSLAGVNLSIGDYTDYNLASATNHGFLYSMHRGNVYSEPTPNLGGVRPIVSLKAGILVDEDLVNEDHLEPDRAWDIVGIIE